MIARTGGMSIYKATFGTYNLSSMIENSYISLMSVHKKAVDDIDTVSFLSLNDGLSVINEPDAYGRVITAWSNYIPATVRSSTLFSKDI